MSGYRPVRVLIYRFKDVLIVAFVSIGIVEGFSVDELRLFFSLPFFFFLSFPLLL